MDRIVEQRPREAERNKSIVRGHNSRTSVVTSREAMSRIYLAMTVRSTPSLPVGDLTGKVADRLVIS